MRKSSVGFGNGDAYAEHFQPPEIIAREGQLVRLRQALAPVLKELKPLHVLLIGPSGSGKTTVAKKVLQEFSAKGALTTCINCMEAGSLYAVLDRITVEHRIFNSDRVSTAYKTEQISRFLKGRPFVLVLDEIDRVLPKDRLKLLYTLSNFGKLAIVGIASKPAFVQSLDQHVRSRFSPVMIEFQPYDVQSLQAIVQSRARYALSCAEFNPSVAKEIALLSRGDARTAIQALRRATVNAAQRGSAAISSLDIRSGWQDGTELRHAYALTLLNEHQRLLFRSLQFIGELPAAGLKQEYERQCSRHAIRPVSRRMFWYYIRELEAMGLIEKRSEGNRTAPKTYRVVVSGAQL